jgi:hypothetical protein
VNFVRRVLNHNFNHFFFYIFSRGSWPNCSCYFDRSSLMGRFRLIKKQWDTRRSAPQLWRVLKPMENLDALWIFSFLHGKLCWNLLMEASKLRKREAENRNEMNVTSRNAHKNQNHFIHSELVACEDLFIGD